MKISGAAFLTLLDKIFGVKLCYLAKSPVPIHVHPSYAVLDLKYEFSAAYVMGPDGYDKSVNESGNRSDRMGVRNKSKLQRSLFHVIEISEIVVHRGL